MGLFQTLLKLIKMASHELIPKPKLVQLHLTNTAVMLSILPFTSEHYKQTALISKKTVTKLKLKAAMKTCVHTD